MLDPAENICGRDGRTKIYQRLSNRFKKCEQTFRMQKWTDFGRKFWNLDEFFGRAYSIWTTNGWLNVDRDVLSYKSVATYFERMTNKRVNDANVTENW